VDLEVDVAIRFRLGAKLAVAPSAGAPDDAPSLGWDSMRRCIFL